MSHNPIDRAISGLFEMIGAPHRMDLPLIEVNHMIVMVTNPRHKDHLMSTRDLILDAREDRVELDRISKDFEDWCRREFPAGRH